MKTTFNSVLVGMLVVFWCSIGSAQIIYSNNFALGGSGNISNTAPTVANNFAGGTNTATWNDVLGFNDPGALLANGTLTTPLGNSWLLPFTPQAGHVYALTASVTFTNDPGNWISFGFTAANPTNLTTNARFTDTPAGVDWFIARPTSATEQFFFGPKNVPAAGIASVNLVTNAGTYALQVILDTTRANWSIASYVNGIELGPTNYTYPANPTIVAAGLGQNLMTLVSAIQWNTFSLAAALQPFIVLNPTTPQTLPAGVSYTNVVGVSADTNGGSLFYQWYANDLPLTNGVNGINGANTNKLIINGISTANQFTNYYVIVTNNFGSATSLLASLTVLTNPVITIPPNPSNSITLFGGSGGISGSSPTFSISAIGAQPLLFQWLTNGVAAAGATNTSFAITNSQLNGPTNIMAIVSNSFGLATNVWFANYLPAPTALYPQAVLNSRPVDFWRLNEPDDGNFNRGVVCHDYGSGNNGVYTNVNLGQPGYSALEPTETSMFASATLSPSYAGRIQGVDFATTNAARFTVEAWASCISGGGSAGGAPVVSKGAYLVNDTFALGVDTNASTKHFQFYIRGADGTLYKADDSLGIQADDSPNWHYLVGVCDEAHSNISLYVDGRLAASTFVPANAGNLEVNMPVAIGAGIKSGTTDYTLQFSGNIDDVALYPSALSAGEIAGHFAAAGNANPVSLVPTLPPANLVYLANQTLTIPATVIGDPPVGYYWTNVTTGGLLSSGGTNVYENLNATLTIPNAPRTLSGDQLELVVTNASSSTNWFVTLFSPEPPLTLDYSDPILYSNFFNGGTWPLAGTPLTAANALVGGSNTTWADVLGTNDSGSLQGNGISTTILGDSWILPFTPHAGYIFTITASLTFTGNPNTWVGIGFGSAYVNTNAPNVNQSGLNHGRFTDDVVRGFDWMILTESTGNLQYFAGPNTTTTIKSQNSFFTLGVGTHTAQVVLDTTGNQWKAYGFVDTVPAGTNTYSSNPTIGAVGITQNTINPSTVVQWNYFTVSQVAPGGVPPYLFNPVPPARILLTNGTVTVPATEFGSAPFGYFWSDNGGVIASGSTGSMAPLTADLSVASSSLTPGQLQLVLTNAFGTNTTLITLVNPNPGFIQSQYSATSNQLSLNWSTNLGWTLQSQTNSLAVGISTNWVNVPNSTTTNQLTVPINPTNGVGFYRLILQ